MLEYLHMQMRLEGIRLNPDGLMESLHPQSPEPPLILIAQIEDGHTVRYFSKTLPGALRNELRGQPVEFRFLIAEPLVTLLRSHGIQTAAGHYKTYVFPEHFSQADISPVRRYPPSHPLVKSFDFDQFGDNVYAIEKDGAIVAACVSARQNMESTEAWVYTAPAHRRQGLAQLVVTAWAQQILREGLVPFYSHRIGNAASAGLAHRLGLTPVFEEIGIDRR